MIFEFALRLCQLTVTPFWLKRHRRPTVCCNTNSYHMGTLNTAQKRHSPAPPEVTQQGAVTEQPSSLWPSLYGSEKFSATNKKRERLFVWDDFSSKFIFKPGELVNVFLNNWALESKCSFSFAVCFHPSVNSQQAENFSKNMQPNLDTYI